MKSIMSGVRKLTPRSNGAEATPSYNGEPIGGGSLMTGSGDVAVLESVDPSILEHLGVKRTAFASVDEVQANGEAVKLELSDEEEWEKPPTHRSSGRPNTTGPSGVPLPPSTHTPRSQQRGYTHHKVPIAELSSSSSSDEEGIFPRGGTPSERPIPPVTAPPPAPPPPPQQPQLHQQQGSYDPFGRPADPQPRQHRHSLQYRQQQLLRDDQLQREAERPASARDQSQRKGPPILLGSIQPDPSYRGPSPRYNAAPAPAPAPVAYRAPPPNPNVAKAYLDDTNRPFEAMTSAELAANMQKYNIEKYGRPEGAGYEGGDDLTAEQRREREVLEKAAQKEAAATKKLWGYKKRIARLEGRRKLLELCHKCILLWKVETDVGKENRDLNLQALGIVLRSWRKRPLSAAMSHWRWFTYARYVRRKTPIEMALEGEGEDGDTLTNLDVEFDDQEYLYMQTICLTHKMSASMKGQQCNVRPDELYVGLKMKGVPPNTWPEYVPRYLDHISTKIEGGAQGDPRQSDMLVMLNDLTRGIQPRGLFRRLKKIGVTGKQLIKKLDLLPPIRLAGDFSPHKGTKLGNAQAGGEEEPQEEEYIEFSPESEAVIMDLFWALCPKQVDYVSKDQAVERWKVLFPNVDPNAMFDEMQTQGDGFIRPEDWFNFWELILNDTYSEEDIVRELGGALEKHREMKKAEASKK